MIASLPMYDRAELRAVTDRFWQAIRDRLGYGPTHLARSGDPWEEWRSANLLLSQTCGYPYRARLRDSVLLVGTPDYGLEGCGAGQYRSLFVARKTDTRTDPADYANARFAYNEPMSQSGWAAPATWAEAQGFAFTDTLRTGGHQASARAVAEGRADLAALDAQSWRLMQHYDAFTERLDVIGATSPSPALPFITALRNDADALFHAIAEAIAALEPRDRDALGLRGLARLPQDAYLSVPTPAPPPA